MKKKVGIIKRAFCIGLVFLFSINSFAAVVSDNDGSSFITKAEFDSLKNSFQSQIDSYNTSLDSKIDGAIASYLAGIRTAGRVENPTFFPNTDVVAYGTANEIKFKSCINESDVFFVTGTGESNYYPTNYGYVSFQTQAQPGMAKIVTRRYNSTNTDYATEWNGWSNNLQFKYIGYNYEYDETGNTKRWEDNAVLRGDQIEVLPVATFYVNAGPITNTTTWNNYGNYFGSSLVKHQLYNCSSGSMQIQFTESSDPTHIINWGQSREQKLAADKPNFRMLDYGDLHDPNIILLNNMQEDMLFNNTMDEGSVDNWSQFISPLTTSNIKSWVANGTMREITSDDFTNYVTISCVRSSRDLTKYASSRSSSAAHVGVKNTINTKVVPTVVNAAYDNLSNFSLPMHTTISWGTETAIQWNMWPQKGWDKNVKYNQLYCSALQNDTINTVFDSSSMLRTAEIDGEKKMTCYAGLPLTEIKTNMTDVEIPIKFSDSDYYDIWVKWGPFTNTANPKSETGLFTNLTPVSSGHTIDSTSKGIKVKNGENLKLKIANDATGYLFIKWSKHYTSSSDVGIGGGKFTVPSSVFVTKE